MLRDEKRRFPDHHSRCISPLLSTALALHTSNLPAERLRRREADEVEREAVEREAARHAILSVLRGLHTPLPSDRRDRRERRGKTVR